MEDRMTIRIYKVDELMKAQYVYCGKCVRPLRGEVIEKDYMSVLLWNTQSCAYWEISTDILFLHFIGNQMGKENPKIAATEVREGAADQPINLSWG